MAASSSGGKILSTEKEIVERFNIPQLHLGSIQRALPGNFRYCSRKAVKDIISRIKESTLLPVTLKPAPMFKQSGLVAALLQQCTPESESLAFSSISKVLYITIISGELICLLSHIDTRVKAECTDGGAIPVEVLLQDCFPPENHGFYHEFTTNLTHVADLVKHSEMEWNDSDRLELVCYCNFRIQYKDNFYLRNIGGC